MLDFLVLGWIPGTHIQITYTWYLFAILGGLAYYLHRLKKYTNKTKEQKQLNLFN